MASRRGHKKRGKRACAGNGKQRLRAKAHEACAARSRHGQRQADHPGHDIRGIAKDRPRDARPDQLFGIDYGDVFRFFALEADRSTESLTSQKYQRRSFEAKLLAYADVLKQETFKTLLGIPMLYVAIVTTSERHMESMLRTVERIAPPKIASRLLFKAEPIYCAGGSDRLGNCAMAEDREGVWNDGW